MKRRGLSMTSRYPKSYILGQNVCVDWIADFVRWRTVYCFDQRSGSFSAGDATWK